MSVSYFSTFDLMAGILNPAVIERQSRALMDRVVLTVESEAKKVTPVRTGHLRRSVTGRVSSAREGVVGSNLIYAPIVHRRNPYLTNGLNNSASKLDALFDLFAIQVASS